jgi:hypothetical protein
VRQIAKLFLDGFCQGHSDSKLQSEGWGWQVMRGGAGQNSKSENRNSKQI